jgi:phage tail-like protein
MVMGTINSVIGAFLSVESTFRFAVIVESVYMGIFTEVTLPTLEVKFGTPIREGGQNGVHKLPTHSEYGNLTLKKGIGVNSDLYDWYAEVSARQWVKAKRSVLIAMIGGPLPVRAPTTIWILTGALPVKWTGPTLKSSDNAIAIESLELMFDSIETLTEGLSPF